MTQKKGLNLYFTNDFSAENVEKLQADGWVLRNNTIQSDIEPAQSYGGDLPQNYLDAGIKSVSTKRKTKTETETEVKD